MRYAFAVVSPVIVLALLVAVRAPAQAQTNLAEEATYAYVDRIPGFGAYYRDDWPTPEHPVNTQGLWAYGHGDLNDGVLQEGTSESTAIPSPVVAMFTDGPLHGRIIFDLGTVAMVGRIDLGTHRYSPWGNLRPEVVHILFSETGDAEQDFTSSHLWDVPTNSTDGRATFSLSLDAPKSARFVQFRFPLPGNPTEVHLDEVWIFESTADVLSCTGFHSPMANYPVTVKGNRALPLKANLHDAEGYETTDLDLTSPPVLQVVFQSASGEEVVDVTDDALPVGYGTEGNEFEYNLTDGVWQYNIKAKNYTAAGTYTITMTSGDDSEYLIDTTCETQFVIE